FIPSVESAMFSGLIDPLRRSIGVRLSFLYALIFTLSSAALFTLAYYLLVAAIGSKDREVLAARLKQAAALYQAGGVNSLRNWAGSQPAEVQNTMFVRLVNRQTGAEFPIAAPGEWVGIRDVPGWEGFLKEQFIRIPRTAERDLLLARANFPSGWVLQMGQMTNSRQAVLDPIRRSFITIGGATIVLGFLAGAFFAHRAMQP